ncbi:hypothetical protein BB560_003278, partial [Smittium megazygosporum]
SEIFDNKGYYPVRCTALDSLYNTAGAESEQREFKLKESGFIDQINFEIQLLGQISQCSADHKVLVKERLDEFKRIFNNFYTENVYEGEAATLMLIAQTDGMKIDDKSAIRCVENVANYAGDYLSRNPSWDSDIITVAEQFKTKIKDFILSKHTIFDYNWEYKTNSYTDYRAGIYYFFKNTDSLLQGYLDKPLQKYSIKSWAFYI